MRMTRRYGPVYEYSGSSPKPVPQFPGNAQTSTGAVNSAYPGSEPEDDGNALRAEEARAWWEQHVRAHWRFDANHDNVHSWTRWREDKMDEKPKRGKYVRKVFRVS